MGLWSLASHDHSETLEAYHEFSNYKCCIIITATIPVFFRVYIRQDVYLPSSWAMLTSRSFFLPRACAALSHCSLRTVYSLLLSSCFTFELVISTATCWSWSGTNWASNDLQQKIIILHSIKQNIHQIPTKLLGSVWRTSDMHYLFATESKWSVDLFRKSKHFVMALYSY